MAALLGTVGEGGRNKKRVKTNCLFKSTSFSSFSPVLMSKKCFQLEILASKFLKRQKNQLLRICQFFLF